MWPGPSPALAAWLGCRPGLLWGGRPARAGVPGPSSEPAQALTLSLRQVDDILGEGSDDSDSEKRRPEEQREERGEGQEGTAQPREPKAPGARRGPPLGPASSSDRSPAGTRGPR